MAAGVSATPTQVPTVSCPSSLQGAIDSTPTGGILALGVCVFHETVTVGRAMTISGPATIDGDGIRPTWMRVTASKVTVEGLTMRNAAAGAVQSGSLDVDGVDGFTLRHASLSGGSYADLRLWFGSGHRVIDSDVSGGRAIGVLGWQIASSGFSGNRIHNNNTAGFDPGWEAGGLKLGKATGTTLSGNEVDHNAGPGLWCDGSCSGFVVTANAIHHNTRPGVLFETGRGATISDNRVWENGWSFPAWGWGGGIVISSSAGAEVARNLVAWNADGIVVLSQSRPDAPAVTGNSVHDNTIALAPQAGDGSDKMALAWLQDWNGSLFNDSAGNRGASNRYWVSVPEPQWARFGWKGALSTVSSFNSTPGEEGGLYISDTTLINVLGGAGMPTGPRGH